VERDKQNGDPSKVRTVQIAAAFMHPCLRTTQNPFRISLDTADFVRHVPDCPISQVETHRHSVKQSCPLEEIAYSEREEPQCE
jgi:hypothetical protein